MPTISDFVYDGATPINGVTVGLYKESDMSLLGIGVTGAEGGNYWPEGVSNITYSDDGRTVVSTTGWIRMSLAYPLPTTGKYYVEMDISGSPMIGMVQASSSATGYLGQSGNAASVGDGNRTSGFFSTVSGSLDGTTNIALCADMDAGYLYVYRSGTLKATFSFTANASGLYFAGSPYPGRTITVKDAPTSVISGYTYIQVGENMDDGEYSISTSYTGLAFLVFRSPTTATPPDFTDAENHKISRINIT